MAETSRTAPPHHLTISIPFIRDPRASRLWTAACASCLSSRCPRRAYILQSARSPRWRARTFAPTPTPLRLGRCSYARRAYNIRRRLRQRPGGDSSLPRACCSRTLRPLARVRRPSFALRPGYPLTFLFLRWRPLPLHPPPIIQPMLSWTSEFGAATANRAAMALAVISFLRWRPLLSYQPPILQPMLSWTSSCSNVLFLRPDIARVRAVLLS